MSDSTALLGNLRTNEVEALAKLLWIPWASLRESGGKPSAEWLLMHERQMKEDAFPLKLLRPKSSLWKASRMYVTEKTGLTFKRFFPKTASLCERHHGLNPWLIQGAFALLTLEVTKRTDRIEHLAELAEDAGSQDAWPLRCMVSRLHSVNGLWLPTPEFDSVFSSRKRPFPASLRLEPLLNGSGGASCAACVLSVVGSQRQLVIDLHASMTSRRRSRGQKPRLLRLLDAWIQGAGPYKAGMLDESAALSSALRRWLSREIDLARKRREVRKTRHALEGRTSRSKRSKGNSSSSSSSSPRRHHHNRHHRKHDGHSTTSQGSRGGDHSTTIKRPNSAADITAAAPPNATIPQRRARSMSIPSPTGSSRVQRSQRDQNKNRKTTAEQNPYFGTYGSYADGGTASRRSSPLGQTEERNPIVSENHFLDARGPEADEQKDDRPFSRLRGVERDWKATAKKNPYFGTYGSHYGDEELLDDDEAVQQEDDAEDDEDAFDDDRVENEEDADEALETSSAWLQATADRQKHNGHRRHRRAHCEDVVEEDEDVYGGNEPANRAGSPPNGEHGKQSGKEYAGRNSSPRSPAASPGADSSGDDDDDENNSWVSATVLSLNPNKSWPKRDRWSSGCNPYGPGATFAAASSVYSSDQKDWRPSTPTRVRSTASRPATAPGVRRIATLFDVPNPFVDPVASSRRNPPPRLSTIDSQPQSPSSTRPRKNHSDEKPGTPTETAAEYLRRAAAAVVERYHAEDEAGPHTLHREDDDDNLTTILTPEDSISCVAERQRRHKKASRLAEKKASRLSDERRRWAGSVHCK